MNRIVRGALAVALASLAAPAMADDRALDELRAAMKAQQQQLDELRKTVSAQAREIERLSAREPAAPAASPGPSPSPSPSPSATDAAVTAMKGAGLKGKPPEKKWYEKLRLQGYTQIRTSGFLDGDRDVVHDLDPSIRPNTSFFIRRARLIFLGDLSERVFMYFQPDFAATPGSSDNGLHFAQIRDAYFDLYLTADHDWRVRVGQSKIPYSFEALQSSGNRIPLERNDAVTSATLQERDLGTFVYWGPKKQRDLLNKLRTNQLKGSGEYGVVGFGVYNGQGANRPEANDNVHAVARVTWPHELPSGQIIEGGVAAYSGKVVPRVSTVRVGGRDVAVRRLDPRGTLDQRVNAHFVLYPQPFGLQAEYNVGRGPELDLASLAIGEGRLHGGYIQAFYKLPLQTGVMFPFIKYQKSTGAEKYEVNAPRAEIREWDLGVEWQPQPAYELVLQYKDTDRTDTLNFPYRQKQARLLQMQLQVNY